MPKGTRPGGIAKFGPLVRLTRHIRRGATLPENAYPSALLDVHREDMAGRLLGVRRPLGGEAEAMPPLDSTAAVPGAKTPSSPLQREKT